jgi:flavorubredoxin
MFTYLKQDKFVFTCDFLGAHYCAPYLYDTDVKYIDEYKSAVENYYQCIFGPFPRYVKNGLKRLSEIDYECVLNSHGPILTKNGMLKYVLDKYNE